MNIESTAQSAPTTHREPISRSLIRGVFLRNGFRIEDGRDDLPDWVYEGAFELLEAVGASAVQGEPASHEWDEQDKCRRCGDRDWYAGPICTPKQPAEQQPDVTQLVEALEQAGLALHEMDEGHAALVDIDNALAAYYRKEGEV